MSHSSSVANYKPDTGSNGGKLFSLMSCSPGAQRMINLIIVQSKPQKLGEQLTLQKILDIIYPGIWIISQDQE